MDLTVWELVLVEQAGPKLTDICLSLSFECGFKGMRHHHVACIYFYLRNL